MVQKRLMADLEEGKPHCIDVLFTFKEYSEGGYPIDAERAIAIIERAELSNKDLELLEDYIQGGQNNSMGKTGRTQKAYLDVLEYLRNTNPSQ